MNTPPPYEIRVYCDKGGQWRWRMVAPNGRTVADSAEGYVREFNAIRAAKALHGATLIVRERPAA